MERCNEIFLKMKKFVVTQSDSVVEEIGKYSVRSSDFRGWLLCDGRSIDRAIYKNLFDLVGTAFGSDNATTFKLPNFKGRVPGAAGAGQGLTARALGATVGEEMHTLIVNEIPSHDHAGVTGAAGRHNHGGRTGE